MAIQSHRDQGHGRLGKPEYANSCSVARGSVKELETLIEIVERVGYFETGTTAPAKCLADEVGRMLTTLIQRRREPGP